MSAVAPAREGLLEIDVAGMAPGVYIGTLENKRGYVASCKVVIQ